METNPYLILVYRILLSLAGIFVLIFLGGTIYGLFFGHKNEAIVTGVLGIPNATGIDALTIEDSGEHVFSGIGRLRLSTAEPDAGQRSRGPGPAADQGSATVILTITFPYSSEDRAFAEELAARVRDFRNITENYFKSISARDLHARSEDRIKAELLERFNNVLRLGKIQLLYFNDFLILDN